MEDEQIIHEEGEFNPFDIVEEQEQEETSQEQEHQEVEEQPEEQPVQQQAEEIPFSLFVDTWKKEGFLDSDYTLPEDLNPDTFKESLKAHFIDRQKEDAEREYIDKLKTERGLDDYTLEVAQKLASGVSPATAGFSNVVNNLKNLDIESDTDESYKNRESLIRAMYRHKGIPDNKIDNIITNSQEEEKDLEDAKEAVTYFEGIAKAKEADDIKLANAARAKDKEVVDKFNDKVATLIKSDKILDGVDKNQFHKDLYTATEWITDESNGTPNKIKVSKWVKTLRDSGLSIVPLEIDKADDDKIVKFLNLAHILMYGDLGKETLKKKAKEEVEDSLDTFLRKQMPKTKLADALADIVGEDEEILI